MLGDDFEKIEIITLKSCGLCPSHCLSAQALNWDAMLNITKVSFEIISDANMYFFLWKSMKGGVSYISKRYSKVHNKYLTSYDPKQESKHIIYLDANNLYDYVMSNFLPTNGFKWINHKEFDLNKHSGKSSKVCVPEVDVEYPKELRELHNGYPLAPDNIEIKTEMLSNYQIKIPVFYNISIGNIKLLVPNFFDKGKYVLHYENLNLN